VSRAGNRLPTGKTEDQKRKKKKNEATTELSLRRAEGKTEMIHRGGRARLDKPTPGRWRS